MRRLPLPLVLALAATLASTPALAAQRPAPPELPPALVTPGWLARHLGEPDLVLLHVGPPDRYPAAHLPGARLVTLDAISLSAPRGQGLVLELPPADELRRRLEALGLSSTSRVVVYPAEGWVSPATRVLFTLDAAGLGGRAGLLDGGLQAWVAAGMKASDEPVPPPGKGSLAPAGPPPVVDAAAVARLLGTPGVAVVDARNREFYDGTRAGGPREHPHRKGHIPGALSVPFDSLFDEQDRLLPEAELAARFAKAGVRAGDTVVGYCHIGQQATALLFAARRLGHQVLLYDGSFEDWSQLQKDRPVETSP